MTDNLVVYEATTLLEIKGKREIIWIKVLHASYFILLLLNTNWIEFQIQKITES